MGTVLAENLEQLYYISITPYPGSVCQLIKCWENSVKFFFIQFKLLFQVFNFLRVTVLHFISQWSFIVVITVSYIVVKHCINCILA